MSHSGGTSPSDAPTAGMSPHSAGDAMTGAGPHDHRYVIAIDGPAAAGKTTVALALADRLGAMFLDTGLLYRAVTLAALRRNLAPSDGTELGRLVRNLDLRVRPASVADGRSSDVLVDGEDVTPELRSPLIDRHVSAVARQPLVRQELLPVQRQIASGGRVVMVGRDIGTVVVPDAGVKVYLDADDQERARRRHRELVERGLDVPYEHVLAELRRRDAADSSRDTAPLTRAPDAIRVDSSGKTIGQVVDEIAAIAQRAWAA